MNARRRIETATERAGERLIAGACRVIPDRERTLRQQEWIAEQASILDDLTRPWLLRILSALGFPLSLAWSLRSGSWHARHAENPLSWRAALNAVSVGLVAAYFFVPSVVAISLTVGSGVTVAVAASTATNTIPGTGVVSVPAVADEPGLPAIPTSAAIAGVTAAILTSAVLTALVVYSWLSHRRPRDPGTEQPAQLDR